MVAESKSYSTSRYDSEIDSVLGDIDERTGFGWSLVRLLGELQVLTRASYIMLVVVPLLAGLWPGVTVVVNRYNDTVEAAIQRLELTSAQLELTTEDSDLAIVDSNFIQGITTGLRNDIDEIRSSISDASIKSSEMPDVWVWVFLSALCAIAAHTIYQVRAPQIIRDFTDREYINLRMDEEAKINGGDSNLREVVLKSREDYFYSSRSKPGSAAISLIIYLVALAMIFWVIITQTRNVLQAAGWL